MRYTKPAVSFQQQLAKLKERGLLVKDERLAITYLKNISYYRLRAYTYPFQDNNNPEHPFIEKVSFEQIIQLYQFDRKLRIILFDVLERIEIALRTQIIYEWSIKYGSHWHENKDLAKNTHFFNNNLDALYRDVKRSKEQFIEHYYNKYCEPEHPPSWMALEVANFNCLSLTFKNLKDKGLKKKVSKHFGIYNYYTFENWIHVFVNIRNICAHHSRLWNKRITPQVSILENPMNSYVENKKFYKYKLYAVITAIAYIVKSVNPATSFKERIKRLMKELPVVVSEEEMGFTTNWEKEKFWINE